MAKTIGSSSTGAASGCGLIAGCWMWILAINCTIGWYCAHYCFLTWFGKTVVWPIELLAGLIGGEFTIPLAFFTWVATLLGVHAPFWPLQ